MRFPRWLPAVLLLAPVAFVSPAHAQQALIVPVCDVTPLPANTGYGPLTISPNGVLCSTAGAGGGGGGDASAALQTAGNSSLSTIVTNTGTLASAITSTVLQANTKQINGVVPLMGNGVTGTGSQRVTVASDNTPFHTIIDTGSTTAVTGNVTTIGAGTAGTANANPVTVQGIAGMTKLLVTPDSVALPANQSVNEAQINGVTPLMGNGVTGTGAQRVTISSDNTPFPIKIDQTTPGTTNLVALAANQSVNLAQVGGTNTVNGGVAGSQSIGGTVATNVAITDNPINTGAQAVSSENAAVTTARKVQLVADLVGKLIVLPYANPENFVSGVITSAMTGTTSTSLIAAPAAGLRNYITQCTFSNSHATVGTDIILQDGSGGTTIYLAPAAPAFGGATITFPTPLRQPTTATALFVANVTTGANTKVACSGYKGA